MAAGDNGLAALLEAFGVGDKSVKTDRSNQLAAWGNLKNIATTTAGEGGDATGQALKYFTSILNGSPTAVQGAVAPTTNAVAAQQAAQNRDIVATGTSRGGGTNAAQQQTGDAAAAAVQAAINSAAPNAAPQIAQLGSTLTGQSIGASGTLGAQAGQAKTEDQIRSDQIMDALTKMFSATKTGGQVSSAIAGL
jgi:hypothetical protein